MDRLVIWGVDSFEPEEQMALEDWVEQGNAALIGGWLPNFGVDWATGEGEVAYPTAVHAANAGIEQISTGPDRFGAGAEDRLIHLKDADGAPVLISWAVGDGRIYWSADTEWLSNQRIAYGQNLDLALQVLMPDTGGKVAFDEYHHGYASATRWWQILRGSLQTFLLLLIAAVALLFWAYGARFGSPRPAPATPPRAAVEYVYSMSQLYRRAGASGIVLQALYRSLSTRLGRLVGGARGLSHGEIARRSAQRTGLPAAEIERLLDQTAPNANRQPSEAELIQLARKTERLQRRIDHAGYRDQRDPAEDRD